MSEENRALERLEDVPLVNPLVAYKPKPVTNNWRAWYETHNGFDDDAKAIYLEELQEHGFIMRSAAAAGVTKHTVQLHRKKDPEFAKAEEEALEVHRDYTRARVREIGLEGIIEPVFGGKFKDRIVGHKRIIAPAVTILEAKRVDPAYRDKAQLDVTHKGGVLLVPGQMSADDWAKKHTKPAEVIEVVEETDGKKLETEETPSSN